MSAVDSSSEAHQEPQVPDDTTWEDGHSTRPALQGTERGTYGAELAHAELQRRGPHARQRRRWRRQLAEAVQQETREAENAAGSSSEARQEPQDLEEPHTAPPCPSPTCEVPMVRARCEGDYVDGWECSDCGADGNSVRWFCSNCNEDLCDACGAKRTALELLREANEALTRRSAELQAAHAREADLVDTLSIQRAYLERLLRANQGATEQVGKLRDLALAALKDYQGQAQGGGAREALIRALKKIATSPDTPAGSGEGGAAMRF